MTHPGPVPAPASAVQAVPRRDFAAVLDEALEAAARRGRLDAAAVESLLACPGFDGGRFATFLDAARARGIALDEDAIEPAPQAERPAPASAQPWDADPEREILRLYRREIERYPLLSAEREIELARARRAGDERARRDLILGNLRLVVFLARRYRGRGLADIDLIEEGNLGLITAADRYDPERGVRFGAYASWWIRQAILAGIATQANAVRIPVRVLRQVQRYMAAERLLRHRLGHEPALAEIAQALGLAPAQVERLARLRRSIGAHEEIGTLELHPGDLEDAPGGPPPSVETLVEWQLDHERLEAFLRRLSDREESVLRVRYGFHDGVARSLQQTGETLGVSRERVRQIEERALAKLRTMMGVEEAAADPSARPLEP